MKTRIKGARRLGAWRILVLLAAVAALGGCGDADEKDELSGPFGQGSVGTPVSTDPMNIVSLPFTTSDGNVFGQGSFDSTYFTPAAAPEPSAGDFGTLANAADGIWLSVVRIAGRPDTPCRFRAARMARDEGFAIDASGDRTNAAEVEFHQTNLHGNGQFVSLYCAKLRDNAGVQVVAINGNAIFSDSIQLIFVLNSIR